MQYHRVFSLVFALAVGVALALYSFERISDPEPAQQRAREEAVVMSARVILRSYIPTEQALRISDPLARIRVAGKVYIYPTEIGWEVSGHYRRDDADYWHPFLMVLDSNITLVSLAVRDRDARMIEAAEMDPRFSVAQ